MVAARGANAYDDAANHMGERESPHRRVRIRDRRRGMIRRRERLADRDDMACYRGGDPRARPGPLVSATSFT